VRVGDGPAELTAWLMKSWNSISRNLPSCPAVYRLPLGNIINTTCVSSGLFAARRNLFWTGPSAVGRLDMPHAVARSLCATNCQAPDRHTGTPWFVDTIFGFHIFSTLFTLTEIDCARMLADRAPGGPVFNDWSPRLLRLAWNWRGPELWTGHGFGRWFAERFPAGSAFTSHGLFRSGLDSANTGMNFRHVALDNGASSAIRSGL
jgi:hypothetical protein